MKALVVMCLFALACGGSQQTSQPVNVTGTWTGSMTSSVSGPESVTMTLVQAGTNVSGTYALSIGATGNTTGQIAGNQFNFNLVVSTPGCSGMLQGVGTFSGDSSSFLFTYAGSTTCGGAEQGSGSMSR